MFLTQGGVEKVASKIDDLETQLGSVIEGAKAEGKTISTNGMQAYLDEVKDFFRYDADVEAGKKAIQELDDMAASFKKEYGEELPIDIAQKIKVSTGQKIAKYYDRLTDVGIEGRKQMTRYLKDKIVEKAPIVGDVNTRLSSLYQFDKALSKAQGRIGKLNLLGLPSKLGGAIAGPKGAVLGKALEILDSAGIKSTAAIGLNELSKLSGAAGAGARIPVTALLNYLLEHGKEDASQD